MKKLMLLFFVILLVGTVSAFEFDNVKNYDEETKTIDIRNSILGIPFLQLGKVAEIKLNTPQNYLVPIGYRKVAEFEVTSFDDYKNAFKELELFDKKAEMKKFYRDYDFKSLSYKTIIVDDYENVLVGHTENGTALYEYQLVGNHQEEKEVWVKLTPADFKKDDIVTIGIFTEVLIGDSVEWIPNFFGVRIDEWAVWTASLNVQIVAYWKLDETSGTNAEDSTGNGFNLTASDAAVLSSFPGIINSSADFRGGVFHMRNAAIPGVVTSGGTFTISMWVNGTSTADQYFIDNRVDSGATNFLLSTSGANLNFRDTINNVDNLDAETNVFNGSWNHLVIAIDGTSGFYYFNGVSTTNFTLATSNIGGSAANFVVGGIRPNGGVGTVDFEGVMDEFGVWNRTLSLAEVEQLYNGGVGITFIDVFLAIITLNAPVDTFNSTSQSITFNATVVDNSGVQNVTLFIDGTLNETNSSGVNGTYIFERNISDGNHNWSIGAVNDGDETSNSSVRTFSINTTPIIIVISPTNTTFNTSTIFFNASTSLPVQTWIVNYNGTNVTLPDINTSLTVEDGNHHLFLFGNNSVTGVLGLNDTILFAVDTSNPSVIINSPVGRQPLIKIGDNETVTWNITDLNLDTCLLGYNGVNTTLNCTTNTTSFLYVNGVNNLSIFANDTVGNSNTTTTSWDYSIIQVNQSFNSQAFTTSAQTFAANITINSEFTDTPTSPSIIYNGTTTTGGTVTSIGGDNYTLSQTIDIPDLVNGTSDWLFSFTLNSSLFNSSTSTQTVIRLDLVNCNAANSFINFTFKNETLAEEDVNATFDSIWNYFIGSGGVTRTLSFTNATENPFYGFCLNAANDTLFTLVNVSYSNSISQQRQFRPTLLTLTNTTTSRVLYLLPTVDGLFNTFRTENTLGNTIVGARGVITRTLSGNPITSAIDITDGSGVVIFFLDPDVTYTATFSASGFLNNVFTFVPTTDLRIVIMGSTAAPGNGTNISIGMNYTIEPPNTTLNNGTDITFRFIVSEGSEPVTFIGFNISNDTTTLLLVNQTSDGTISGILNTRDNSSFTGVFTISTINETLTITKIWRIEQSFIGDYSIFRQFNLYMDYDFKDFIRLLLVIATLAAVMIFMSREIGIDEEVKMAVAILIVWAFSIVGWLDTGIAINSSSANINNLSQFSNQYGIAIVSTIAAAYFILRRVFRQI